MSGQPPRNNSGALFKNDRRENDKQPSHTGQGMIDGKEVWISAWVRETRSGSRYFSLAFKPKLAREMGASQNPAPQTSSGQPKDDFQDDIPF